MVAVRDSDYARSPGSPPVPELDRWLEVYLGGRPLQRRRARRRPPAAVVGARRGLLRGRRAGSSTWCYASPEDRAWWGGLWADRVVDSALAAQAVERGIATADELAEVADGWRRWAAHDDGWFSVLHGEVLATP